MYSSSQDITQKNTRINLFEPGFDRIQMEKIHFLPTIELRLISDDQWLKDQLGITSTASGSTLLDIAKMSQHFQFVLNLQIKKDGVKSNEIKFWRPCTKKDFEDNGISMDDPIVSQRLLRNRICPNIDRASSDWGVSNSYSNNEYRQSFSVELWKCNSDFERCKPESDIDRVLKSVYFTMYLATEGDNQHDKEIMLISMDKVFL